MHAASKNEIITIRGLNKTFGAGDTAVTALSGIDLTIYEGEIFGIIGLSGAGKSTLVRCMNYLEKPTEGSVVIAGQPLETLQESELLAARRNMGMIFQQFNLLMQKNTLQNICFPLEIAGVAKSEAVKRARELLSIVELTDKEKSYPAQLSGGQKQRVAIARALAANPKVLLCDEATSALDPTTTRSILNLLKEINQKFGITIVVITHEMSAIEEICSRVAIIDNSKIAEIGSVEDIFMRPKTEIAKRLLYASGRLGEKMMGERCLRIVFDGTKTSSPVISNMVLECGAPVNLLFADTKTIEGKMVGYTLVQLPDDDAVVEKMKRYLDLNGVHYLEEAYHV
ncbi:MAG: ATP-binding cassette domain-containing protein [Clostridia bacterium]|nr:ATP-binding cassette domain-containing protein [Clostridia bacterium]